MRTLLTLAFWMVGPWSTLALAQAGYEVVVLPTAADDDSGLLANKRALVQSESARAMRTFNYHDLRAPDDALCATEICDAAQIAALSKMGAIGHLLLGSQCTMQQ